MKHLKSTLNSPAWRNAALACAAVAVLASPAAQAQEIKLGGSGAALGTMQLLAQAYVKARPGNQVTVLPSMGSGGGIKAVLAGAIQIGLSSRPLSEAETQGGAVAQEYGRTPFIFATATANAASAITSQALVDYYAGTVQQWPDGSPLRLVLRPIGDSDTETLKQMSPAMRQATLAAEQRKGMIFAVTDQDTASSLEKTPGSLGPSTLAQLLSEKRSVKALALDGVMPSAANLANGRYPMFKRMLLVTGPKTSAEALAFTAFVRSASAQDILRQTGHWVQ